MLVTIEYMRLHVAGYCYLIDVVLWSLSHRAHSLQPSEGESFIRQYLEVKLCMCRVNAVSGHAVLGWLAWSAQIIHRMKLLSFRSTASHTWSFKAIIIGPECVHCTGSLTFVRSFMTLGRCLYRLLPHLYCCTHRSVLFKVYRPTSQR